MKVLCDRHSRVAVSSAIAVGATLAFLALNGGAQAQSQPIQSPQDAACRNEARSKVFVTPDPHGLGLHAIGRQIYMACMQRLQGKHNRRSRG